MAVINGSVSRNSAVYSHYCEVSEVSQSISGNQTKIRVSSILKTENLLNKFYTQNGYAYIKVDGAVVLEQNLVLDANPWKSNPWIVQTWEGWVSHADDGSKKISVETYIKAVASTYGPDYCTTSGSVVLTTIPRVSSVAATDANIGSTSTIIIDSASTSFTHSLWYKFSGQSSWTPIIEKISLKTYGWKVPDLAYALIPSDREISCQILCRTFSGTTAIGDAEATLTVTTSEAACRPSISAMAEDVNPETLALTGNPLVFVKWYSNVRTVISAAAKNSASITAYGVLFGDGKKASVADSTTYGVGSADVSVSCSDSRRYVNSYTVPNLSLVPYVPLTANVDYNRPDSTADEVVVTVKGKYFNGSFGAVSNTLTMSYRIKDEGGDYGDTVSLTPTISGDAYSLEFTITELSYRSMHVLEIHYSDKLISDSVETTIFGGIPVFDWGKDDFRFNVSPKGMVFGLGSASAIIEAYEDFNTYTTPGVYGVNQTANAQTILNIPVQQAGLLRVYSSTGEYRDMETSSWAYVLQEYRPLPAEFPTYIRTINTDGAGGTFYGRWYPMGGVDYVIERGTFNYWTYEKWQSGKAECWAVVQHTTSSTDFVSYTAPYPFPFVATPVVTVSAGANGGWLKDRAPYLNTVSATEVAITYRNAQSAYTDVVSDLHIHAIGRWK